MIESKVMNGWRKRTWPWFLTISSWFRNREQLLRVASHLVGKGRREEKRRREEELA